MKVRDVLVTARELISTPDRWCQRVVALDRDGIPVDADEPDAFRRCAKGAVIAANGDQGIPMYRRATLALSAIAAKRRSCCITCYNDTPGRAHEDILSLFDEAIAACPE